MNRTPKYVIYLVIFLSIWNFNHANMIKHGIKNVVDVSSSSQGTYFLNNFGIVYVQSKGTYMPLDLPDKIIQIQAVRDSIFMLREDGSVWRFHAKGLHLLDGDLPNQQILASDDKLYMLKRSGGLSVFENNALRSLVYDRNFEVMVMKGSNSMFLLDSWGRLFHYDTYAERSELADPSRNTIQLVSGDGILYMLKKDGQVFKYEDLEFHSLDFDVSVETMAAEGDFLFFIDKKKGLFEYNRMIDRLTQIDMSGKPSMLRVTNGKLYVVDEKGDVFEYVIPSKKKEIQAQFNQMWNSSDMYPQNSGFVDSSAR
ncbi:MAG: hypothetical protein VX619_11965 [bacterium]|nr:hypothetical protein [bacterium]